MISKGIIWSKVWHSLLFVSLIVHLKALGMWTSAHTGMCIGRLGSVFYKKNYNRQPNGIAITETETYRLQVKTETESKIFVRFGLVFWAWAESPIKEKKKKTKSI